MAPGSCRYPTPILAQVAIHYWGQEPWDLDVSKLDLVLRVTGRW